MRKLSGWQRIGVFMSGIWPFVAAILIFITIGMRGQADYKIEFSMCYDYPHSVWENASRWCATAPPGAPSPDVLEVVRCRNQLEAPPQLTDCLPLADAALVKGTAWTAGDYEFLLGLTVVPILLLWVVGGAIIWIIRWVASGFRKA
jgi:hypothetical protein